MNKLILLIIVLLFLLKCTTREKNIDLLDISGINSFHEKRIPTSNLYSKRLALDGPVEFTIRDSSFIIDWVAYCSNDEQLSFSLPSHWEIIDDQRALLFCRLGENKESYFALLVHNKEGNDLTIDGYKDLLVHRLKSDTIELFDITELSKFDNGKRAGYFLDVNSVKNQIKCKLYTLIAENTNYIFDFSMRLYEGDINITSKEIFNVSAHSFQVYGSPIIGIDTEFTEIKIGINE